VFTVKFWGKRRNGIWALNRWSSPEKNWLVQQNLLVMELPSMEESGKVRQKQEA